MANKTRSVYIKDKSHISSSPLVAQVKNEEVERWKSESVAEGSNPFSLLQVLNQQYFLVQGGFYCSIQLLSCVFQCFVYFHQDGVLLHPYCLLQKQYMGGF